MTCAKENLPNLKRALNAGICTVRVSQSAMLTTASSTKIGSCQKPVVNSNLGR